MTQNLMWVVPVCGLLAILFAIYLAWDVLRRDTGTDKMRDVGATIYEGAVAFIKRQYTTIAILAVITALVIGGLIALFERYPEVEINVVELGIRTGIAFLAGAAFSAISGIIGMYVAVKSNLRCASAAGRSVSEALTVALRGGAVSGFLVVSLSLLGVAGIFYLYGGASAPHDAPFIIVGFGFGASFVALFAQLGGGIYTKAADVGADLVGKVEAGIPEDDPRNAAVVADLVGDNVGDCAGRGADLFESTVAENIGAMILGVALAKATGYNSWIFFPLVVRALGLIASMVGLVSVRLRKGEDPITPLIRGYVVTLVIAILGLAACTYFMLGQAWRWFFVAGLVGLLTSLAIVAITEYYTGRRWRPVRSIAEQSKTGAATNIIAGLGIAFENTAAPVIVIAVALIGSFWAGAQASSLLGVSAAAAGIYGTAVSTMGMLMTCAYILAMDTFGPIADNAGGIVEMAGAPEEIRRGTDALDAAGNTTKALTKGYAIGSAALAAFLLFSAYLDKVELVRTRILEGLGTAPELIEEMAAASHVVDLSRVEVFAGATIGAMLIFLFSAFAIRAVGNAASQMIEEVRRQFREDPGIMTGESRPDYARAVDISTRAALKQMIVPGVLAVATPIVVGIILRAEAEAALLMVGTMAGIILATVMNNGGAAWDNAKKSIEAGLVKDADGNVIAKGSETHAASVVGDTVGDPLKDTAGPSVHVLIKLLSTITLVLAPLFISL
jgi:K(+)-stimulated pyrophosphate-energized sodium pump